MKTLFSQAEFDSAKSNDKLPLTCKGCNTIFFKKKKYIYLKQLHAPHITPCSKHCSCYKNYVSYCSRKCQNISRVTQKQVNCANCTDLFMKNVCDINKTKNNFCSRSCAAIYRNTHKTTGTRRSKLEIWLESQLTTHYPILQFDFNKKNTINSELDIYIPSLKLAFELNGIFHYEPIYGGNKLNQIKNNDNRKFQACLEHNIELCIVDTSKFINFKENKAKEFLDIICNIINFRKNFCQDSNLDHHVSLSVGTKESLRG